jgi:Protein of unknown function (DUF3617)
MIVPMVAMMFLTGQNPDPAPALKVGLWESMSVTVPMGATGPAAARMKQKGERMGSPITTKWLICRTPEPLGEDLEVLTRPGGGCAVKKREVTEHGFVVSASCTAKEGKISFDHKAIYDSMEMMHSSTTTTIEYSESAGGGSIVMNDTTKQNFIKSDCGTVQPGKKVEIP